jgi:hypothetical protein
MRRKKKKVNSTAALSTSASHSTTAATLSTTAATLEAAYKKAIDEEEDTEKKIKQAELLKGKLSDLKSSDNFKSPEDLMALSTEIKTGLTLITKAAAVQSKIDDLEKEACEMRTSNSFVSFQTQQQLREEINTAKEKLQKALNTKAKISEIERNPAFLQLSDIEQLKDELDEVKIVFQNISSQEPSLEAELDAILKVQNEVRDELECVVCLEVPSKKVQVLSCLEHHLLCSDCAKQILQSCPVCRQNFRQTPPTRNRLAEKMIHCLN